MAQLPVFSLATDRQLSRGVGEAVADKEAALIANSLFGYPVKPEHADLDVQRLESESLEWIEADHFLKEVVVQSLRIAMITGVRPTTTALTILGKRPVIPS